MAKRIAIECSHAISLAAKLANVDVVAAYPITPQTHIVEKLSEYVADGELDAEYINVESEHSAMSACIGASAVGARVFTATAGQGLALMHEMLFIAAGNRLPIVMAVANRSLSPNLNIWGDQSDMMASKDCGWIQIYAENAQEVFDFTLQAFKIAEDERVMLPVAINFDGFYVTHVIEPIIALDQEEVKKFLPPRKIPSYALHPDHPTTWGPVGLPDVQTELKRQLEEALRNSKTVIKEVWKEFGDMFGRYYDFFEPYRLEDAEIAILMAGGHCGTARIAVDRLREKGEKVGLIKLRLFRPFPDEELIKLTKNLKVLAVVDKAFSPGGLGGPIFTEVKALFYDQKIKPEIVGFIAGLGGRDIRVDEFMVAVERAKKVLMGEKIDKGFMFLQVRE
ncbi:pyruvate ferredoxin oxidoreductase [Candidatus Bathyarchaeota archaeon]|nr:MAG: pyruvate ferredoxin oxidoreductase [Candidatus Bathyarchaeota archaeon]RLI30978.1 MAG: pyruvate ferredoxin oxidoreductase [Candidatus Bathyarchaeota archaeon]